MDQRFETLSNVERAELVKQWQKRSQVLRYPVGGYGPTPEFQEILDRLVLLGLVVATQEGDQTAYTLDPDIEDLDAAIPVPDQVSDHQATAIRYQFLKEHRLTQVLQKAAV